MSHLDDFSKNLERKINLSKKSITVMFTDIEASSKYWDTRGDIKGRLLIDTHNRLLFPLIKKYKGKVIKTIGDAIMATFKKPDHAILAAVAMQQILAKERESNPKFPKIRIAIHTGHAIVENNDVYGDMVNVASRIEGRARGNDILLSAATTRKLKSKDYNLNKKERFIPKGKKTAITLYASNWETLDSLVENFKVDAFVTLNPKQKWELRFGIIASILIFVLLFFKYLRYFLLDSSLLSHAVLNPQHIIKDSPLLIAIVLIALGLIGYLLLRIKTLPLIFFRFINAGKWFSLCFILCYLPITVFKFSPGPNADHILYESHHNFVEVVARTAIVFEEPDKRSNIIRIVPQKMLLLQNKYLITDSLMWNRVFLGHNENGWIANKQPPKIGVPEKRITLSHNFKFKLLDIYILSIAFLGFLWGFFSFKIRPA